MIFLKQRVKYYNNFRMKRMIWDVYIFILSHNTDKIKIETYVMCTPYMEAVTAVRFTFEYRYPIAVNQDQEHSL